MNLPQLNLSANYPIKNCPEGFEAQALLKAWTQQLANLLATPGAHLSDINICVARLTQIAHEATEYSRPELLNGNQSNASEN
jgi:hypothetical protein